VKDDRPLAANEVDADPSILRHPDARHRTRNRSGQKGGASKLQLNFPFSWRSIEMLQSPAYRTLSLSARKILDRLEIEFERHGRNPLENGCLPCTYEDFVEYGIHRQAIAPAIRELVALGFIRITRKGSAGNESHRQPTLYLISYRHAGSDYRLEDGWKAILTIEEAEARAKAAREAAADRRAREFGKRGAAARLAKAAIKNKIPVSESVLIPVSESVLKNPFYPPLEGDSPVSETEPLSRVSQARAIDGDRLAGLQWSAPRLDIPGVVWSGDVHFPVNVHYAPGSIRAIIRGESVH
jgi:hypothetical protein